MQSPESLLSKLKSKIGEEKVFNSPAELACFIAGHSAKGMLNLPSVVVRPRSIDDVVNILKIANEFKIATTPVSSGTMMYTTHPKKDGLVIDLSFMDKIIEINTDSDYAIVESGVTIGQLLKEIRPKGYWCPFGSYPPFVSVLGNYTERGHSSMRSCGIFDDILGLEIVTPEGIIFRTGSSALNKDHWHTPWGPFPDLRGLFMGASGCFGVFVKGAVRIYPLNEKRKMVLAGFDDYSKSINYCQKIARAGLMEHNIIYHWVMYVMFEYLYGYSKFPDPKIIGKKPWEKPKNIPYNIVTAQMSGYKEDMEVHEKICKKIAEECGGHHLPFEGIKDDFPGCYEHWKTIGIDKWCCKKYGKGLVQLGAFSYVYASPKNIIELENIAMRKIYDEGLTFGLTYYSQTFDRGRSQSIRFTPFIDPTDKKKAEKAVKKIDEYYKWALKKYGATPMLVQHPEQREMLPETGGYYEVWKKIKKALDPNNIMNPHILW